jgi:hypothetical protein
VKMSIFFMETLSMILVVKILKIIVRILGALDSSMLCISSPKMRW